MEGHFGGHSWVTVGEGVSYRFLVVDDIRDVRYGHKVDQIGTKIE